jgi:folate-binding protein YgfZ
MAMIEHSFTVVGTLPADVLHVGGEQRVDLLNRLSTNDLTPLHQEGNLVSTVFLTAKGRIKDWAWLYSAAGHLVARLSSGRADRLSAWLAEYTILEDVSWVDASAQYAWVIVQGPEAASVAGLSALPPVGTWWKRSAGMWTRGLLAYGPRVEGLVPRSHVEALLVDMQARGGRRVGADELEDLRLAAGVPSPQFEFDDEVNPLELRLGAHAVSWTKGCYIGQEVLARMQTYDKIARVLIGFECDQPIRLAPPLKLTRDGRPLGRVTSMSKRAKGGCLGLAIVKRDAARLFGATMLTPEGQVPIRLADRPFWSAEPAGG